MTNVREDVDGNTEDGVSYVGGGVSLTMGTDDDKMMATVAVIMTTKTTV